MTEPQSQTRRAKKPKQITVPPQVFVLIQAAISWSRFQDEDSRKDQETDSKLATEAAAAKERLLAAIEKL